MGNHLKFYGICCALLLLMACENATQTQRLESKNGFAVINLPKAGEQLATFAGGCFWATQECMLELKGVNKVVSGYAGGQAVNPTYEQVVSGTTGHAESIQVYYDPAIISFETLTRAFFYAHDPTQADRQGPDIGTSYRSIAFFRNPEEYRTIQRVIREMETYYNNKPIVTEVLPFKTIYPAETEHQDYYPKHSWDSYIRQVSRPKVLKIRKEMHSMVKPVYLK